jgi:hypothetical protein
VSGSPTPVSPERLTALLAELAAAAAGDTRVRVAIDGADAASPWVLADAVSERLRAAGAHAVRVSARDFLRPASLRFEYGRTDPESYAADWLDTNALTREVLTPLAPDGDGAYLPTLWDAAADRATRAPYAQAPRRAVVLVDGPLLLGRGLPFDLAVHLRLSESALRRRTPDGELWTLPALLPHAPDADVIVRYDDPRHPAVQLR